MDEPRQVDAPRFFVPLESLRGLAALCVVVYHAAWLNPVTAVRFFQNGALMVDFFFVLSGFVICHSYGRRLASNTDVLEFLWLRLGRLYPLHLALLLVFLGFEVAKLVAERRWGIVADKPAFTVNNGSAFLLNLLLIQSLGIGHARTYNFPSWSISTEFYTYVLFALVTRLLGSSLQFVIAAGLIVAVGAATLLSLHIVPIVSAGHDWGYFRCALGFFLGALIYHLYIAVIARRGAAGVRTVSGQSGGPGVGVDGAILIGTVLFLCILNPDSVWTYLVPPLSAVVILAIVLCPPGRAQRVLSSTPLAWLGRVSYSLYMVHAAVAWILSQFLTVVFKFPKVEVTDGHGVATPPLIGLIVLCVYVATVLVVSHFTYRLIEDPFRKRSREAAKRWFRARTLRGAPQSAVAG